MMKEYFEEGELAEKVQSGEMNIHDFVTHHSPEWDQEYAEYCEEQMLDPEKESSADMFLAYKDQLLTRGHIDGSV